jgi:thioesterase domain-containing protein
MAAKYVNEIQAVQNRGPYLLGGYCLGGTIALEMAQQLRAKGQEVALLALLDTYNWTNIQPASLLKKLYYYLEKIEFHYQNFLILPSKGKVVFFREKAKELKRRIRIWFGMVKGKFGNENLGNRGHYLLLARLWENNDRAASNYVPKFYPGKITLFLPKRRYSIFAGPNLTFENLAREVEICELPLYPAGMLVEPFVERLAQKLKACIDQSLRNTNPPNTSLPR